MALSLEKIAKRGGAAVFYLLFLLTTKLRLSRADVGTAAHYNPPYTQAVASMAVAATACYGFDPSQFPSSFLFAAAGEGIWDNGAACGRQYLVRCISGPFPGICDPTRMVQVRIVDLALTAVSRSSAKRATIVLSNTAFQIIAKQNAAYINVEYIQV